MRMTMRVGMWLVVFVAGCASDPAHLKCEQRLVPINSAQPASDAAERVKAAQDRPNALDGQRE
ncbi:MAG TPA: hypothetical protein VHK24_06645 [Steroidobacter sp.]|nr:hypothetical protein [Steroidobacter sp.]